MSSELHTKYEWGRLRAEVKRLTDELAEQGHALKVTAQDLYETEQELAERTGSSDFWQGRAHAWRLAYEAVEAREARLRAITAEMREAFHTHIGDEWCDEWDRRAGDIR